MANLFCRPAAYPVAACRTAVNAAGLFADDIARAAGDDHFRIRPRKGEFFVFDPPAAVRSSRSSCPCRAPTQGRARLPDNRREGRRQPDGGRPGGQARLVGAPRGRSRGDGAGAPPDARARGGDDRLLRRAANRGSGGRELSDRAPACPRSCTLRRSARRGVGSLGIAEYVLGCLERMGLELGTSSRSRRRAAEADRALVAALSPLLVGLKVLAGRERRLQLLDCSR